jgi:hypothetical protein
MKLNLKFTETEVTRTQRYTGYFTVSVEFHDLYSKIHSTQFISEVKCTNIRQKRIYRMENCNITKLEL